MYPALVAMPVAVLFASWLNRASARARPRASVPHFGIYEECETRTEVECRSSSVCFRRARHAGPRRTIRTDRQVRRVMGTFDSNFHAPESRPFGRLSFERLRRGRKICERPEAPPSIHRFNLHLVGLEWGSERSSRNYYSRDTSGISPLYICFA